jgi:site-specific DNA recombinase
MSAEEQTEFRDGEMRAAIYARVSTDDQAKDGFSIAAQVKRLKAYCKARNWQITGEYVDEGQSGRSSTRPEYQKMMVEKDNWDVLVVLKMDRIHRNSKNFTIMMDNLMVWGKEFNSMQESFDTTTAMGRFVMDIIQRIAQLESEQIGERVKLGMTQKAKKGKGVLGSGVPYGYRFYDHKLIVVPEEAELVQEMFTDYASLMTLQDIARSFNSRGILTKQGLTWEKATIHGILTNPLYTGKLIWNDIEQDMSELKIVGSEIFSDTAVLLHKRKRNQVAPKQKRVKNNIAEVVHA